MSASVGRARSRGDAGTISLSTVIVVTVIILFLALVIMAGRVAVANSAVESAANEAARAASISRTVADAQAAARATADVTLSSAGLDCTAVQVSADLAALAAPLGQAGQVSITVTCAVPLSDLASLGVSGRTITYTATSVVDPYRSR